MRVAFVGAGEVAVRTAEILIGEGHEVIVIEKNEKKVEELSESMDCSFLLGDGSEPDILKEVSPESTDFLFCLSNSDQDNILASLVGRSLGFKRVVTSIVNTSFESICTELGLTDTIIPSRTISRDLADMVGGEDAMELSSSIRGDARLFAFHAGEEEVGPVGELELPEDSRAICFYRGEMLHIAHDEAGIREGDEVVLITTSETLEELGERWPPETEEDGNDDKDKE